MAWYPSLDFVIPAEAGIQCGFDEPQDVAGTLDWIPARAALGRNDGWIAEC